MSVPAKNLKLDSKKRITLGKFVKSDVTSYDVELKENGVIDLYPKVEIPAEEVWLFKNKTAMDSVKRGLENSKNNEVVELEENFWE